MRWVVTVSGSSESGKSTRLATILDFINANRYQHFLTMEDPSEFVHKSKKCQVNQREVNRDILDFNEVFCSALLCTA